MGAGASRRQGGRTTRLPVVAVLATVMVAALPPVVGAADSRAGDRRAAVIVRAKPGSLVAAAQQVQRLGGQVGRSSRSSTGSPPTCRPARSGGCRRRPGSGR